MNNDSISANKKRRKPFLLLGATAVLVLGVGAASLMIQSRGANGRANRGEDDPSSTASHLPAVVAIGVVDVDDGAVALLPLRPGRVAEVLVHENQTVAKGAVLLRLDDRLARLEVQEAEVAVQVAEAQLTEARQAPRQHQLLLEQQRAALAAAQYGLAAGRLLAAHRKKLVESRLASKDEADAEAEGVKKLAAAESAERAKLAALELHDPELDLTRSRADLQAKQALLNKARYALEEQELRAPANGSVLRRFANPGELLGPQSRQPAFLFCPDKPRVVRAELEQEFANRVCVGQQATIQNDGGVDGPTWKGHVIRISAWIAPRRSALPDTLPYQEARTLECVVQLDPGSTPWRIGQRVRVKLLND